ncbi:hypothetical protein BGZ60DRAFT_431205 [Tricladium varicosporioides]|nr:hypothetical protein BGZ60DRAFT_431205 [Hymenoscyphus varicosporioides]
MSSSRWEFSLPSSAWSPWGGNQEPDIEEEAGAIPLKRRTYQRTSLAGPSIFSESDGLSSSAFGSRRSRSTSGYFAEVCQFISSGHIDLPEEDPVAVELFIGWINNFDAPLSYNPSHYSAEPWPSKAAIAYIFAKKIKSVTFEKYSLSQFIQNCSSLVFGPWGYIEQETQPEEPLRRFSDFWIAWNCYFLAAQGENEFSGLEAVGLSCFVTDKTKDPRTFDLEHWYDTCGNSLDPDCTHHEILRQERQEREKVIEIEPVDERGRSLELRRQAGILDPKPRNPSPISHAISPTYPSPPSSPFYPRAPHYNPTPAPIYQSQPALWLLLEVLLWHSVGSRIRLTSGSDHYDPHLHAQNKHIRNSIYNCNLHPLCRSSRGRRRIHRLF